MARQTISQLRALYEGKCAEVEGLKQELALLRETQSRSTKHSAPSNPSERRNLMNISKLVSSAFACTTRINGNVIEYFKPSTRTWCAVPNARIEEVLP